MPRYMVKVKYVMDTEEHQKMIDEDSLGHMVVVSAKDKEHAKKIIIGQLLPKMVGMKGIKGVEILNVYTPREFMDFLKKAKPRRR